MSEKKVVEIGTTDVVLIDKLYGPLVMCDLQIHVDSARGEWVISRQVLARDGTSAWETVARIDGQNSIEFDDG